MSVTSLEGKKVLIVGGGGQGIGREVTRLFGASGGELAVVDLDETRAQEAADDVVDGGGKAFALAGDVRSLEVVESLVAEADSRLGQIDVLVMIVGGLNASGVRPARVIDLDDSAWDRVWDVNFRYAIRMTKAVVKTMLAHGIPGSIVGIGSYAGGYHGSPFQAPYGTAKIGLTHFAMTISTEHGPDGIRMNIVAPGWTETPMGGPRPHTAEILETIPMRRRGKATDIANAVLYFASEASGYVSGQTLMVDGGLTASSAFLSVLNGPNA